MEIFKLKIEGLLPSSTSMLRLSSYMEALAKLMGEKDHVRLDSIESGSLIVAAKVDYDAIDKVAARFRNPNETRESAAAHARLRELLAEDSTTAEVLHNNVRILHIAPRADMRDHLSPRETISIRGKLIAIGGKDESVPFTLVEQASGQTMKGNTSVETAKALAHQLFNFIEISGTGIWRKKPTSTEWELLKFKASSFTPLKSIPVNQAASKLRELSNPNARNPLEILKELGEQ